MEVLYHMIITLESLPLEFPPYFITSAKWNMGDENGDEFPPFGDEYGYISSPLEFPPLESLPSVSNRQVAASNAGPRDRGANVQPQNPSW